LLDRLDRKRLEPRRLASGAIFGVVIGVFSALLLESEGHAIVSYVGIALAVAFIVPWILAVVARRWRRG
jgi:hypothetical protein